MFHKRWPFKLREKEIIFLEISFGKRLQKVLRVRLADTHSTSSWGSRGTWGSTSPGTPSWGSRGTWGSTSPGTPSWGSRGTWGSTSPGTPSLGSRGTWGSISSWPGLLPHLPPPHRLKLYYVIVASLQTERTCRSRNPRFVDRVPCILPLLFLVILL